MRRDQRTGYVFFREARDSKPGAKGSWWYRTVVTVGRDDDGKPIRKVYERKASTKAEAHRLCAALIAEINRRDSATTQRERATFAELATFYVAEYAQPAVIRNGRKISGLKSFETVQQHVKLFKAYFRNRRVGDISYSDLRAVRNFLIAKPKTVRKRVNGELKDVEIGERSIAHVNRMLATLHRMFRIAVQARWITRSPFEDGDPLICLSQERSRERILTKDEEHRLLAQCTGRRAHIRPLLIAALDTGARRGELLKLTWNHVDLEESEITFVAANTKNERERRVEITPRLSQELQKLRMKAGGAELVFPSGKWAYKSFQRALKLAGIEGVRFHDLRHTAATRLVRGVGTSRLSIGETAQFLGHRQISTTLRYVTTDREGRTNAASILHRFQTG